MHIFVRKVDEEDGIRLPFTYIGSGHMEYVEGSKKTSGVGGGGDGSVVVVVVEEEEEVVDDEVEDEEEEVVVTGVLVAEVSVIV